MTATPRPLPDHDCAWRQEALELRELVRKLTEQLAEQLARQNAELNEIIAQQSERIAQLERIAFGKTSEKMPSPADDLRRAGRRADPEETKKRRAERRALKAALPEERVVHDVPEDERSCSTCGGDKLRPLGDGEESVVYERVCEYFVRHVHIRRKYACRCGSILCAPGGPLRVAEQTTYGPGLIAHLIVSKCADSTPFYRLEKRCLRTGMPLSRSTMVDLFHRAAGELKPLYIALMAYIASQPVVQADETTLKMQRSKKKSSKGWMWTFLTAHAIGYRFAASRSGDTPLQVLGGTEGTLVVDAYTGYNRVCTPAQRARAGCLAHARRKLYDARDQAPELVEYALARILDAYRVEHDAKAERIVGTRRHLALRQDRSRVAMGQLHDWLTEQEPKWPPRGGLGTAIGYALRQWKELTVFLDDVGIPVDNNASERALRVVALGRKNFLFVGHEEAGQNTAMLYSLVSSCEANGVNPEAYLADVLLKVQSWPAARVEELLPHRWKAG